MHKGHRQRMRERFLQTGLNGFQEHEILEFLLFHAIPRRDTNPLAHRLLQRFGGLHEVLAAPIPALREIEGMTENAAVLIHLIAAVYAASPEKTYRQIPLDSTAALCAYFQRAFAYETHEQLRALCLDEQGFLRSSEILAEGTRTNVTVTLRQIVELAIRTQSTVIVLAHSHPDAKAAVSRADLILTQQISAYLRALSIQLADHIIVGKDSVLSMRETGCIEE